MDEYLRQLIGNTAANKLKLTTSNLYNQRFSTDDVAMMWQMKGEGYSLNQIGTHFGTSKQYVGMIFSGRRRRNATMEASILWR